MNSIISQYFNIIEARVVESPVINSYQVLRREIAPSDGKIRIKVILNNGGSVELFEYVSEVYEDIKLLKYSFHWQDSQGKLISRWDNAPHHQDLPNAPHHIHLKNGIVQEVTKVPNIFQGILQILGCCLMGSLV